MAAHGDPAPELTPGPPHASRPTRPQPHPPAATPPDGTSVTRVPLARPRPSPRHVPSIHGPGPCHAHAASPSRVPETRSRPQCCNTGPGRVSKHGPGPGAETRPRPGCRNTARAGRTPVGTAPTIPRARTARSAFPHGPHSRPRPARDPHPPLAPVVKTACAARHPTPQHPPRQRCAAWKRGAGRPAASGTPPLCTAAREQARCKWNKGP